MGINKNRFDDETWASLPTILGMLPESISLHIWADPHSSAAEKEAVELADLLSQNFEKISYRVFPQRISYAYYPVIGVIRSSEDEQIDYGIRIIGLPLGYQMTSLLAAAQCVSFQGMTSEAKTRIQIRNLSEETTLELITSADDEAGTVMAQRIFNMAVISRYVRSYLIMSDAFPEALTRYSVSQLPHLVINRRVHLTGVATEESILHHIARNIGDKKKQNEDQAG